MKIRINFYIASSALFIFLVLPIIVYAQTAKSNCVITKIGNIGDQKPVLPPECQTAVGPIGPNGLITPPGLACRDDGYCKMPESDDGSYRLITSGDCLYGSKELITVLYSVAKTWKQKHSGGYLFINDLNGPNPPHSSHKWGRAVDLVATTDGADRVADMTGNFGPYNRPATVELGQIFAATDQVVNIWYNDQPVNNDVLEFVNDPKGSGRSSGMVMMQQKGHENHFHLDVKLDPYLPVWQPGC
ncbi:MAG TPA: hypothetical protein VM077_04535 [Candidatus Limnocylindrales bacterium]|nr:hypothetical protein [Candidatus Limnocylindrales bacterium]